MSKKSTIQPKINTEIMIQAQATLKRVKRLCMIQNPTRTTEEILLQYIEENKEDEKTYI